MSDAGMLGGHSGQVKHLLHICVLTGGPGRPPAVAALTGAYTQRIGRAYHGSPQFFSMACQVNHQDTEIKGI